MTHIVLATTHTRSVRTTHDSYEAALRMFNAFRGTKDIKFAVLKADDGTTVRRYAA